MIQGPPDEQTLVALAAGFAKPRQAGGSGDESTRRRLRAAINGAGLEVLELPFRFRSRPLLARLRIVLALQAAAFGAAAGWPDSLPVIGTALALSLLSLAILRGLLRDDDALVHAPTRDGLGGRTATLVARAGESGARRTAVVIAHHDSKSQNISFLPRLLLAGMIFAGLLILPASLIVAPLWSAARCTLLIAASLASVVMATISFSDESPGALDNAGSLAVLVRFTEELAAAPPVGGQVLVAFTGAEEWLMAGARHLQSWLRGEGYDPSRSMVFNLDGVGGPGPVGLAGPRADRERVVRWSGPASGLREMPWIPGSFTDATIFRRKGWPAITFTSSRAGRGVRAVHTSRDRVENLDSSALEQSLAALRQSVRGYLGESR